MLGKLLIVEDSIDLITSLTSSLIGGKRALIFCKYITYGIISRLDGNIYCQRVYHMALFHSYHLVMATASFPQLA